MAKKLTLFLLSCTLFFTSPVQAETTAHLPVPVLEPVVVTSSTGREQKIDDVQASVQIITEQDLQSYTGTNATEALKLAIGVNAQSLGSSASISMRGLNSSATLILIDGQRRTNKYGSRNLNMFPTEEIERIEVIRGPMSALYGADASGGVINIITRKPKLGSGLKGSGKVLFGTSSHSQRKTDIYAISAEYGGESLAHRISIEERNRGHFYFNRHDPTPDLRRNDEDYYAYDGLAHLPWGGKISWRAEKGDQDNPGPGFLNTTKPPTFFRAYEREKREFYSLAYQGEHGPGVLDIDLSQGDSDARTTRAYPKIETTKYRQTQIGARYTTEIDDHILVFGAGEIRDKLDINTNSQKADRRNSYVLIQDEWNLSQSWKLLMGLRHDKFNEFGVVNTPRFSVQYHPGPWSVRLGYGEAYRAPSVLEQYSLLSRGGRSLIVGNPNLKPEKNHSWELAFNYATPSLRAEAVFFRSRITDLITTQRRPRAPEDPASITSRHVYTNIANASISGSELSLTWKVNAQWLLFSAWEYLDARDSNTDQRLKDRARHTLRLGLSYETGPWTAHLHARYLIDYFSSDPNDRSLTPVIYNRNVGTSDFKLDYRHSKALTLSAGLDNIFNSKMFSTVGTPIEPAARFAYVSARYAF